MYEKAFAERQLYRAVVAIACLSNAYLSSRSASYASSPLENARRSYSQLYSYIDPHYQGLKAFGPDIDRSEWDAAGRISDSLPSLIATIIDIESQYSTLTRDPLVPSDVPEKFNATMQTANTIDLLRKIAGKSDSFTAAAILRQLNKTLPESDTSSTVDMLRNVIRDEAIKRYFQRETAMNPNSEAYQIDEHGNGITRGQAHLAMCALDDIQWEEAMTKAPRMRSQLAQTIPQPSVSPSKPHKFIEVTGTPAEKVGLIVFGFFFTVLMFSGTITKAWKARRHQSARPSLADYDPSNPSQFSDKVKEWSDSAPFE